MQRHAPLEIFNDLKDKVLAGEVTVNESREIEQQYRPERKSKVTATPQLPSIEIDAQLPSVEIDPQLPSIEIDAQLPSVEVGSVAKGFNTVQSHVQEGLGKLKDMTTNGEPLADKIANNLSITLADWSKRCAGMRYPPKFSQAHTEVRVSHERKRLRLDLVGVVRWSFKKPKDVFGVEIKSSLSDFESDRKWENYLNFCDYFCFAISRKDTELWEAIENKTESKIGILAIDFEEVASPGVSPGVYDDRAGSQKNYSSGAYATFAYPVEVIRSPQKLAGNSKFLIYETLYERLAGWSSSENGS